ncbi:hypothetical protein NA57DRAFT_56030 [Rhizodiscina lignyota]|uniref:A-kinase anchor protein 7-like phosphoesterase domain-containing protein n=1 Tax=Rhizodiscina lignyota TaxID=1504668 RepID=A0A9P4MBW1_9PEZI|nr:hypothetical protein NA57DRAFT_56030 [Rhizodiscina lignyota]
MARKRGGRNISKAFKGGVAQDQSVEGQSTSSTSQRPKKPPLTHFLCVPLVTASSRPQLQQSLARFRDDIKLAASRSSDAVSAEDPGALGEHLEGNEANNEGASRGQQIPASAVRPVGALHLTIGVMSLTDPDRIDAAFQMLNEVDLSTIISPELEQDQGQTQASGESAAGSSSLSSVVSGAIHTLKRAVSPPRHASDQGESKMEEMPAQEVTKSGLNTSASSLHERASTITVALKSLHSMHPARKTSILYAGPDDPSGLLLPLCKHLRTLFTDAGLMVKDDRQLKLHATVLNTIYVKRSSRDRSSGHGPNARAPLRVDATALLELYKDFVWADGVRIEKIAICKMGAKKTFDAAGNIVDEAYEEVASIPLLRSEIDT